MIITLVKADFSAKNIGTLDSFAVLTNILNATYDGPMSVSKDGSFTATITMHDGYVVPDNIAISMGGNVLTNAYSISGDVITISIAAVTGIIVINMSGVAAEDAVVTALPLVQGYIDNATINSSQTSRVRSNDLIKGPFSIELNNGYLIRALYEYSTTDTSSGGTVLITSSEQLTSYEGGTVGKYYGITLCKTNSNESLAPTEDIVKSFAANAIVAFNSNDSSSDDDTVAGEDVAYTLINGASVQSGLSTNFTNRVTTSKMIKGKFTVTVNDGFAIRAVYEYTDANGSSGSMVGTTSTTRTTFTSTNDNKYYGVTFTYSGDENADNDISPTENIVAEWKYV